MNEAFRSDSAGLRHDADQFKRSVPMTSKRSIVVAAFAALATASISAQSTQTHQQHLDARGKHVMGFDQHKTTHHFLLYDDGGAIDVGVKDAGDTANRDAVRSHLPHIAHLFSDGAFDAPMLVHDRKDIPGIADLARLKAKIKYTYTETAAGGRVDIVTTDKEALAAVHAFLKFQIEDHGTGDRTVAVKRPAK
jgi:hypothetical protein